MEIYSTEEQQEEAIKKAIKENWLVVVLGAAIGLGGVWGWRYYDSSVRAGQAAESAAYEEIVKNAESEDADIVAKANGYISEHGDSAYSVMLALTAAKQAVTKGDLDEASKQLKWAAQHSTKPSVKGVAQVRLARILTEQQKYDDALAILNGAMPESFKAQVEELKGDIYVKQGEKEKARIAYQAAADNDGLTGNNALQFKIDNLTDAGPQS